MWGSLGMNLDQRGKCVCGGVPCPRPGRTRYLLLPGLCFPPLGPARLPESGVDKARLIQRVEAHPQIPQASEESGFPPGREEAGAGGGAPGGRGAARPSEAAGASSGAARGPAGPLLPGPELRPHAGLTRVSVRLCRLQ